jgi:N-acetylglucosamine-6-phosphate deacetylase
VIGDAPVELRGRLVLDDEVVAGGVWLEGDAIAAVELDRDPLGGQGLPLIAQGFVDVHVHGWAGHDAMGSADDLGGMARALLAHGVTSFLPTAVTSPLADLRGFADRVRAWLPRAPHDGAEPLGFNLEGPFLAPTRKGAHNPAWLASPGDVAWAEVEPLLDGLRLITIAPELAGSLELIQRLTALGIRVSIGHSAASAATAHAAYDAGASSTTHLFNAMSGVDHHAPGVAVAALTRDDAWVELIADGLHVDPALWPIVRRMKPIDRLILVSDALAQAGLGDGRSTMGGLDLDIRAGRATLADGSGTLAGSVIALDSAVRNLVRNGASLPAAVAAAGRNPLDLLGIADRGRIVPGQRADLVDLDDGLVVRRVMRGGVWRQG